MPDCDKELRWIPLPKPCQRCFGVGQKRARTDTITSKSQCDSVVEPVPKVRLANTKTEHTKMLTDNMLLNVPSGSETKVTNDTISSSLTTASMTAAIVSSVSNSVRQNVDYSLPSMNQHSSQLDNIRKTPQMPFVRPLFKNSVLKLDAQLIETDDPCSKVSNVKATAAGNFNEDSNLHCCPLCDMVFDSRFVILLLLYIITRL